MKLAYLRASTKDQTTEQQERALILVSTPAVT